MQQLRPLFLNLKIMELSVTELERLWILCANHADKCKEGGNKQKYYNDLAKKLYNAANRKAFKN